MLQSPSESEECYNFKQFEELIMQIDNQSQSSQKEKEEDETLRKSSNNGYHRPQARLNQVLLPLRDGKS